jgi:hypothetical protein
MREQVFYLNSSSYYSFTDQNRSLFRIRIIPKKLMLYQSRLYGTRIFIRVHNNLPSVSGPYSKPLEFSSHTYASLWSALTLPSHLRLNFEFCDQQPTFCMHFSSSSVRYMSRASHIPWLDQPNNIWWRVQIMNLLRSCLHHSLSHTHTHTQTNIHTLYSQTQAL